LGRDSIVSIATHYRLDGPGIESWWGWDFLHLSRLVLGLTQSPIQLPGIFPEPGHGVECLPPSSAKVKEKVELYLYSPSGPLWPVLGWTLPWLYLYSRTSKSLLCLGQVWHWSNGYLLIFVIKRK
jgi:hypothetical protein